MKVYAGLLRDRTFVGLVLVAGLAMAALFAYVAGSSFVFQEHYGLSEQQFGLAFGAGAIGLITATQLNVRLLRRYSPQRILVSALTTGSVAGLVLLGFAITDIGGLPAVLASLWAVLASAGWPCPTRPPWRCRGTGRRPAPQRRCWVPCSSASGRWPPRWSGCWAPAPWRWASWSPAACSPPPPC